MDKRIDFYITNPNHHWDMFRPIMLALKREQYDVRLVSLCEFRRMDSPVTDLEEINIPYVGLASLKSKHTSTTTGKKNIGGNKSLVRSVLRWLIWNLKLKRSLISANVVFPALAIVANDVAYPMGKICDWLTEKQVPFILFQEGIRFPLPNEEGQDKYGTNGAHAVFVWGKKSAEYFKEIGISIDRIKALGNPRFDKMIQLDYSSEIDSIKRSYSLAQFNLYYVSNPVDDQGFVTFQKKMDLFKKFIILSQEIKNEKNLDIKVWIRLHPREDIKDFEKIIINHPGDLEIESMQHHSLFACLKLMQASFVLASTVGLESLMNNIPLGVIKLPGKGYLFDYVSSNAAQPIDLENREVAKNRVLNLINDQFPREQMKMYVKNQLANKGNSTKAIKNQIIKELAIV